jgi:hypothetical protein
MKLQLISMAWEAPTMAGLAKVAAKDCGSIAEARRRFGYAVERLRAAGFTLERVDHWVEARNGAELVRLYAWVPGPAKMLNPAKLLKI